MKLQHSCTLCEKPLELVASYKFPDGSEQRDYKCGHSFFAEAEHVEQDFAIHDYYSVNGDKKARDYQKSGVDFILDSKFCCIIADQMRLGKTPQSLLALKNDASRLPALILVRSANLFQWIEEYKVWTSSLPNGIFPIIGSTSFIPPGFNSYVMSMDTLGRKGMVEKLLAFGFKLVIADEAHSFKNSKSKRSQALIQFLHDISQSEITEEVPFACMNCKHTWTEVVTKVVTLEAKASYHNSYCPECNSYITAKAFKENLKERKCGVILLTGTPIKNRADEFFVLLNIVAPTVFPSLASFKRNWLSYNDITKKYDRIQPYRMDDFKRIIAPFFLRREKEDVYTETPALNRMFTVIEVEEEMLRAAYNQVLNTIEQNLSRGSYTWGQNIEELVMLRKICGLAKAPYIGEYVEEFVENSADAKLLIGLHHHDVKNRIKLKLDKIPSWTLNGSDSAEAKFRIMKEFKTSKEQVLLINSLAGGVGMDFHYVNTVLICERQWSPADDEQFEFRAYNPDKSIKNVPTDIEYILAKGTLDEWWHEMLRAKYKIYGETIGTNWSPSDDPGGFKNLLEQTVAGRL